MPMRAAVCGCTLALHSRASLNRFDDFVSLRRRTCALALLYAHDARCRVSDVHALNSVCVTVACWITAFFLSVLPILFSVPGWFVCLADATLTCTSARHSVSKRLVPLLCLSALFPLQLFALYFACQVFAAFGCAVSGATRVLKLRIALAHSVHAFH